MHIRVANFTLLPAGAAESAETRFALPVAERDCRGPNNSTLLLPRVGGAFTQPAAVEEDDYEGGSDLL